MNVCRIHASAMASEPAPGSQARRPNAYQFAQAKTEPHQLRSVPMFDTPAMPVSAYGSTPPSMTLATVEPFPFANVSARSASSKSGPR